MQTVALHLDYSQYVVTQYNFSKLIRKISHTPNLCLLCILNRDYINPADVRPTVGRFIGRLSADKMPVFSSFFIGRQKINYNYLVIFFHRPTVFGLWQSADDRPTIGRRSADDWPISRPMSYLNEPHIIGRCVGRPSADHRPTIGRSSLAYHRPMCRPTVGRRSADCKVLGLI